MNSSSIMSPRTRILFPAKEEISWSARLRVSVMVLQQLLCCRDCLINGDGLNAKRSRCNKATIARTWVALKWILDDGVFRSPRPPSRRIRRTPESNNRGSHRGRQMHGTGIVSNVQLRSSKEFCKFGDAESKQDLRRRQLFGNLGDRRFLTWPARQNGRNPLAVQRTRQFGKLARLPPLRRQQSSRMNHGVRTI